MLSAGVLLLLSRKSSDVQQSVGRSTLGRIHERRQLLSGWSYSFLQLAVLLILLNRMAIPAMAQSDPAPESLTDRQLSFFETRIRPVLVTHCYECHSGQSEQVRGGLLVDSRAGLLQGGDSGAALIPGNAAASQLILALRHETYEMPPDGRLSDQVIADFTEWINAGAVDPRAGTALPKAAEIDIEAGRRFWSFQAVRQPQIPEVGSTQPGNAVDRYLEAGWQAAELQVDVTEASAEVILQRLHFVLSGLLPEGEDRQRFLVSYQQNPEQAISDEVDRLLASRRYAERFGRRFLDVLRFAESTGGGRSMMLPDAWRFRDYVIDLFADDRPFDQVIRELVAGDLLPYESAAQHDQQHIAAGFLILGAINYEQQDKELLRMEVVDEQIDTVGKVFLGMTLGCARCHDHKFDPIPTRDYYALAGIFRSTKALTPGNVSGWVTADLQAGQDAAALDRWLQRDRELEEQIQAAQTADVSAGKLPGQIIDEAEAELEGTWVLSTFQQPWFGNGYHHSDDPRTGLSARWTVTVPEDGEYSLRMVINASANRSPRVPVRIVHAEGESIVAVNQQQGTPAGEIFRELGRFQLRAAEPLTVEVQARNAAPGHVIVDALHIVKSSELPIPEQSASRDLKALQAARKKHASEKPQASSAMSVTDESEPANWHVHLRGQIRSLGPVVPRGFLQVASPVSDSAFLPDEITGSGRLQLADWIANPQNPLTARVWANRIWGWVMGAGLVRTPDNFGLHGDRPDNPELLDFLAHTLVHQHGWSTKSLVKELCLSRAFRMVSLPSAAAADTDPDNRRWTHAFSRKLNAEDLRDRMLQVAGTLDLTVQSGRTIGAMSQYDSGYRHADHPLFCRSVYLPVFRNSIPDVFEAFDFANPNTVTGRRADTTRPAQALYLLNSEFVMQQAEAAAERLKLRRPDLAGKQLIALAVERAIGRAADENEIRILCSAVQSESGEVSQAGLTVVFHSLFASMDFRYLR